MFAGGTIFADVTHGLLVRGSSRDSGGDPLGAPDVTTRESSGRLDGGPWSAIVGIDPFKQMEHMLGAVSGVHTGRRFSVGDLAGCSHLSFFLHVSRMRSAAVLLLTNTLGAL